MYACQGCAKGTFANTTAATECRDCKRFPRASSLLEFRLVMTVGLPGFFGSVLNATTCTICTSEWPARGCSDFAASSGRVQPATTALEVGLRLWAVLEDPTSLPLD